MGTGSILCYMLSTRACALEVNQNVYNDTLEKFEQSNPLS